MDHLWTNWDTRGIADFSFAQLDWTKWTKIVFYFQGTKCYMKSYLKYLPVLGWMWWFAEYVFLKRSWNTDLPVLKGSLEQLKDFPIPFFVSVIECLFWTYCVSEHPLPPVSTKISLSLQLGIFPEGTRFTEAKHQNSLEFTRSRGLPELQHHLFPRTKGVAITLKYLKDVGMYQGYDSCSSLNRTHTHSYVFLSTVPAVYDIESAYPSDSNPTVKHLLQGGKCEAHLFLRSEWTFVTLWIFISSFVSVIVNCFCHYLTRRIPIEEIPCDTDEDVSQWCRQLFIEKVKKF